MTTESHGESPPRISLAHGHVAVAMRGLPQVQRIDALGERLRSEPDVSKVWLCGSFARAQADRFSDIDLEVHTQGRAWDAARVEAVLGADLIALRRNLRSGVATFEGVFDDGAIVDLSVRTSDAVVQSTAQAEQAFVHRYWVSVLKARKLAYRNDLLIAQQGLGYQRSLLLGALAQRAGLSVPDPAALNIHALRELIRKTDVPPDLDLATALGWPARTWDEMLGAVDKLNHAMTLAEGETSALSRTARTLWTRRDYLPGR